MFHYLCILFLSLSTITSSLCANSVTNLDIQKINNAYVMESSYEELESVLQKDELSNCKKQSDNNFHFNNYLDYGELRSNNYKYKKFIEIHSFKYGDVILCAIVQLDNDNRVTYVYPYTIALNSNWLEVGTFYDITELTYSTEIMVGCIGKYKEKDNIVTRTPTMRSFLNIEHEKIFDETVANDDGKVYGYSGTGIYQASLESENKDFVKIKVIDLNGNPVSNLSIRIFNKEENCFQGYTDKDGIISWNNPKIGNFSVEIKDQNIMKYDITLNSLNQIIELDWDYEHPVNQTSSLNLYFKDKNEVPVANISVVAMVNFETEMEEIALSLGVTDENGLINWINPEFGKHKIYAFYNDNSYSFVVNIDESNKQLDRVFILN